MSGCKSVCMVVCMQALSHTHLRDHETVIEDRYCDLHDKDSNDDTRSTNKSQDDIRKPATMTTTANMYKN